MWYMPYLRVRRAVVAYAYVIAGLSLAAIALRFWPGAVHVGSGARIVDVAVSDLVAASAALVGGFATVLGLNLAAENDGHLEVAWTKPVSREGYALGVFAVDIAAMAACIIFTALCAAVVLDVYAGYQGIGLGSAAGLAKTLAFCGLPLCVYGWIAAASASLKRNRGVVAGLFFPLMFTLAVVLPLIPIAAIHAVVTALNLFNPLAIYFSSSGPVGRPMSLDPGMAVPLLHVWGWGVAALLLAAALLQWRRLQI